MLLATAEKRAARLRVVLLRRPLAHGVLGLRHQLLQPGEALLASARDRCVGRHHMICGTGARYIEGRAPLSPLKPKRSVTTPCASRGTVNLARRRR